MTGQSWTEYVETELCAQLALAGAHASPLILGFPQGRLQREVLVGAEHSAGAQESTDLGQDTVGSHPLHRLRRGHDVCARISKARLVRGGADVTDVVRVRRRLRERTHRVVGLDTDDLIGVRRPETCRETRAAAEVDDTTRPPRTRKRR